MTDNRVRPPVPPGGEQDKDAGTGFDAVPRDWATTADRRAANAGSRFGGSPSNGANFPGDVATLRSRAPVDEGLDDSDALDDDEVVEDVIESARADAAAPADGGGAIVVEDEETDLADATEMVDASVEDDVEARVAPDVDGTSPDEEGAEADVSTAEHMGDDDRAESPSPAGDADPVPTDPHDPRAYDDGAYDDDGDDPVERAHEALADREESHSEVDWFAPAAAGVAGVAAAGAPLELDVPEDPPVGYRRWPEDEPSWNRPSGVSPVTRAERRAQEEAAKKEAKAGAGLTGGFGQMVWALVRLLLGFVFLWAFLDKVLGLGRETPLENSWRSGASPTRGYLSNVDGPLGGFFNDLTGRPWVDWLFMIGLAGIGVALILGIGMTIAAIAGTIMLGLMYVASLPIASNPFVDDHLIYALVLIGLAASGAGLRYSLAPWWRHTDLVRALPFLR
jgi:thiosulfate dehydrogenase (quinone) large subunit